MTALSRRKLSRDESEKGKRHICSRHEMRASLSERPGENAAGKDPLSRSPLPPPDARRLFPLPRHTLPTHRRSRQHPHLSLQTTPTQTTTCYFRSSTLGCHLTSVKYTPAESTKGSVIALTAYFPPCFSLCLSNSGPKHVAQGDPQ